MTLRHRSDNAGVTASKPETGDTWRMLAITTGIQSMVTMAALTLPVLAHGRRGVPVRVRLVRQRLAGHGLVLPTRLTCRCSGAG